MLHRHETLALQVPRTIVAAYKYFIDKKETGILYLLRDPQGRKECMWRSAETNVCTEWHGNWSINDDGFVYAELDFGCKTNAELKWTEFKVDGIGEDYLGRTIRVLFRRQWHYDPATRIYVSECHDVLCEDCAFNLKVLYALD